MNRDGPASDPARDRSLLSGMSQRSTIRVARQTLEFASGHFTIFDADHRERLHGHNFAASFELEGVVGADGLLANYSALRKIMREITQELDERFLLPANSPHLTIREVESGGDRRIEAVFAGKAIPFLAEDVLILPVTNVSLEELSRLICERFVSRAGIASDASMQRLTVRVSSKPGQDASFTWDRA